MKTNGLLAAAAVSMILACAAAGTGCGSESADQPKPSANANEAAGQVLRLGVVPAPGKLAFDTKRLEAKAGSVTIELRNEQDLGHNVRIQTGKRCCFAPGSKDIGGTPTISNTTARVTLDLEPGRYQFLCSLGGHWQRGQRGVLVVRA